MNPPLVMTNQPAPPEALPLPPDALCVHCGGPLAEHSENLPLAQRPRTVCQGLISGFRGEVVGPEHHSVTKTEPPPRVLVCLNLVELEAEDQHREGFLRYECRGCDNWTVAQGRAERGQGFCSKLGAFMNSDDFCSLYEDPK